MTNKPWFILSIATLLVSCAGNPTVERIDSNKVIDLSGRWNDTDSRLVAEQMVTDLLKRPWYGKLKQRQNSIPSIVVGEMRNLSHEHINTATFINDIERELLNSGQVDFIAANDFRDQIRKERLDQDVHASAATRKQLGQEIGADVMLLGEINTIIDTSFTDQVKFYQIDLTLIDISNNRKLWIGQKKIKKAVSNPATRL